MQNPFKKKNLNNKLDHSEKKFRTVAETATDSIIIADVNSNIFFFNSKALETFGYSKEELLGKNLNIIIPPQYREAHRNGVERFLKTGTKKIIGHTVELEAQKKDGTIFPIELSLSFGKEDGSIFFTGIIRDITQRKKEEIKLKASEEKFRLLAENTTDVISVHTPEGITLYISPSCEAITGYKPEELIGKSTYDFYHPEDLASMQKAFAKAGIIPDVTTVTFRYRKKDGTYVWVESTGKIIRDSKGKPFQLHAVNRDITDKKIAEDELREAKKKLEFLNQNLEEIVKERTEKLKTITENLQQSENQLRIITQTLPAFVSYIDKNEIYRFTNKYYNSLFYVSDSPVGKHAIEVIGKDTYFVSKQFMEKALRGEASVFENKVSLKDGSIKNIEVSYIPDADEEGNVRGFVVMAIDLTERLNYEEELNKRNQQLIKTNNDLDSFIYTASHDLKAPIANIEGLASAIKETKSYLKDAELKGLLDLMESSIEKFKNTIVDLTEISRIQKTSINNIEEIDLPEIIDEIKYLLKDLIRTTHARIRSNLKIETIRFSRKNMRSIIYNLLSNAIKYRSPERTPEILIFSSEKDDYTELCIKDNGLGIPENRLGQVFTMFRRFHDHVEGTGVGLYIVKRIIDNAEGKIEVKSEVDKGTIFKVYFKKAE